MHVRPPRSQSESSSSGCQTLLLTSSACEPCSQSHGFEVEGSLLGQVSLSERSLMASCFSFASVPLIYCSSFSICCCSPSSFEGHISFQAACIPSLSV